MPATAGPTGSPHRTGSWSPLSRRRAGSHLAADAPQALKEQTLAPFTASAPATMGSQSQRRRPSPSSSRRIAGALALLTAAVITLLLLGRSPPPSYGVVIDGGSTGSRIHVIAYRVGAGRDALPRIDWARTASMKATPGLSSFVAYPSGAGRSLAPLVEFAKRHVPRASWEETEVRLMATAGLRLLDPMAAESVLESCRDVLRQSGFRFQDEWASVISGAEEGIYAWIAANYALGTLGHDSQETTGIIELGGASLQVTFATSESLPPEFSHVIKFGDVTYKLYSHSFLHLGQNVAYESLHDLLSSADLKSMPTHLVPQAQYKDPCTPRGFTGISREVKLPASVLEPKVQYRSFAHAVGNFSECRSAALTLLQKGKEACKYRECCLGAAFIPELEGKFVATENFYHTSKFFGLHSKFFLPDLMLAGKKFCHGDWSKIKKKYNSFNEGELLLFCFSSAYIIALLHDSLKLPMDQKRIDVANQIRGVPVDWALGAFIVQKSLNQTEYSDSVLHTEVAKTTAEDNLQHGERPVHHNQGQPLSVAHRRWELVELLQRSTSNRVCRFS